MTRTSPVPPDACTSSPDADRPSRRPSHPDGEPFPPPGPTGGEPGAGARARPRGPLGRVWRGRPEDAAWVRPAFLALLAATALLYCWDLSVSGWANAFYSAAVQAGSKSWKAFFYGSSDAANFITVDKPPMSLWPMELSARILGLSSWSVLLPQALMGVAAVGTVYAAVRRRFSALAGLVAGGVLALTPVAALMFRFNNPDALLVLLMTLAAYTLLRAVEAARLHWLLLTGVLFGFGFLTKTLQAFLILPAFALVYLVVAPTGLWRRVGQLLAAGAALVLAGGWWVAIVQLVPAADRPYVGGSQDDSFLSLTFGYNGFGRLTGNETGSVGGAPGGAGAPGALGGPGAGVLGATRSALPYLGGTGPTGAAGASEATGAAAGAAAGHGPGGGMPGGMWGSTGLGRLFGTDIGGQIAWLLPAALALLLFGLWATRRLPRTDSARAAFLVWGGWLLSTGLTFSYMGGIFHQYYTVALAPAIAALVGMGVDGLWRARRRLSCAVLSGALVAGTAWWAFVLPGRSAGFLPWLRWGVLVYMDVDLSTRLNALLPLVAPLISGHSDLAIGSRLARSSRVVRGPKREFISRAYNLILRGSLAARFSDAQCGFKAIRADVAQHLLLLVEDTGWFFDTEMLVLAERAGLRIHEVPVDWVDDPNSTVDILRTATDDLKGVWQIGRALATGRLPLDRLRRPFGDDPRDARLDRVPAGLARQLLGFATVGLASTALFLVLYSLLRLATGPQPANALALLIATLANTAANRRLTFGVRGRAHVLRHQTQGLAVFAAAWVLNAGALAALHTLGSAASRSAELAVLVAANLAATVLRFLLFRAWIFTGGR